MNCVRCELPARYVVSYHPSCPAHVLDLLEEVLGPSEDGRRGSVMVPVGLAKPEEVE